MSCTNCFGNCNDSITSDKCVKYTGPDISCLNICNGASLYEVLQALSDKACTNDLDSTVLDIDLVCTFFSTIMGTSTLTAVNLIQALINGECQLNTAIETINTQLNTPLSLAANCLTLPLNPNRDDILKAVVTLLCSVSTDVTAIKADYVKATQLNQLIALYLQSIGITTAPSSSVVQEYTKMPKYVALPYHGPMNVFDSNGNGLSANGYEKVYICWGQTIGTYTLPDYRGRSPIGANTGVPQTNIDSDVSPTGLNNFAISQSTKLGKYKHTLSVLETAPHTHIYTDVNTTTQNDQRGSNGAQTGGDWVTKDTSTTTTKTTSSTGDGNPHNNTHPVVGSIMIMYVP